MKNLLGFVQNYQQGGYVNPFDPTPTQQDVFNEYDIELTDDKYLPFLPTYDEMGQQFDVTNYIQNRQGLEAGGRSALSQLGQRSRERASQQGFVGTGKSLLDTTRSDIVDQFGRDATRLYTGLQQDVYQRQRGFGEDMLSAIGDLPEDAYTMGEDGGGGNGGNDWMYVYQGDEFSHEGKNYFWDAVQSKYVLGTLGGDDGAVQEVGNPGTDEINWNHTYEDPTFASYQGEYLWFDPANQGFVWDAGLNKYVPYTGG